MRLFFIALAAGLLSACVTAPAPTQTAKAQAEVAAAATDRGIALFVTGSGTSRPFGAAAGHADPDTGRAMTVDTPLRVAINTKTFVAAAALRLFEEGRLDIDSPIGPLLTPELDAIVRADGYDTARITLRQVMSHSAGFYDHGSDPRYVEAITADRSRTRAEQVRKSMEWGSPVGAPGERFRYSDTGYVLLGDIVERASGLPLPAVVRSLLKLDRLGLNSTWWEIAEAPPPGAEPRARQYLGKQEGTGWSGTFDLYGGGGLMMSARDLATAFAALFEGRIFEKPSTLALMQWRGPHANAEMYRLGLFAETVDGRTYYWHGGFWGRIVYYSPDSRIAAAAVSTNASGFGAAKELAGEAVGIPDGQVPRLQLPQ
jgi:D-alanyl-D-alanine carboxypeptidase